MCRESSTACSQIRIRPHAVRSTVVICALMLPFAIGAQDSTAPAAMLLLHSPPHAILNDRPYIVDFIVEAESADIETVSLYYANDSTLSFREVSMPGEYNRHRVVLPQSELQGSTFTYFFLVTTAEYGLWGYPVISGGTIAPIIRELVPPSKAYFQREFRGYD